MIEVSVTIVHHGRLIIIEGLGASVTFYPNNKDETFTALVDKLKELGCDQSQSEKSELDIYKEYYEQREERKISDAEHLMLLAGGEIKDEFRDETGAYYAVIERNGHKEIVNMDYEQFHLFLSKLFYESENKVLQRYC